MTIAGAEFSAPVIEDGKIILKDFADKDDIPSEYLSSENKYLSEYSTDVAYEGKPGSLKWTMDEIGTDFDFALDKYDYTTLIGHPDARIRMRFYSEAVGSKFNFTYYPNDANWTGNYYPLIPTTTIEKTGNGHDSRTQKNTTSNTWKHSTSQDPAAKIADVEDAGQRLGRADFHKPDVRMAWKFNIFRLNATAVASDDDDCPYFRMVFQDRLDGSVLAAHSIPSAIDIPSTVNFNWRITPGNRARGQNLFDSFVRINFPINAKMHLLVRGTV